MINGVSSKKSCSHGSENGQWKVANQLQILADVQDWFEFIQDECFGLDDGLGRHQNDWLGPM